ALWLQCGSGRLHTIPERRGAAAGDGGDHAVGVDFTHPVGAKIRDEEAARRVRRNSSRELQPGFFRGTAIAREPGFTRACYRSDRPGGGALADAMVFPLGDEQVSRGVHGQSTRSQQARRRGRAAVSRLYRTSSRHPAYSSSVIDLEDTVEHKLSNEQ